MISDRIDCDVYRIEAADPYPDDYDDAVAHNVAEQNADARPGIAHAVPALLPVVTYAVSGPALAVQGEDVSRGGDDLDAWVTRASL